MVVVLDNIRSAHNVGSIFRTADALRVERLVCCGFTPTPDHPSVQKTALGAEGSVPWEAAADVLALLSRLRAERFTLAALEQAPDSRSMAAIGPEAFPLALVLGNEVTGVQPSILELCDAVLELPQYGSKTSLNVAVAFGVAGYALLDRWMTRAD